jgi:cytochrome d ubiquinol oxidase subunit II
VAGMLAEIWFVLLTTIVAGYLILDGFDMGTGILHIPVARTDAERRTFLNSIGPFWDGNAVWLILTGGVLFAAFPLVYASLFSGFYVAFMLVLVVLILRAVSMEFRSKETSPRWRSLWDGVFALASIGLAFLLGVAFGNIISGVPLDANGNMSVHLVDLLTPFALLVGVTTVAMLAMHGCLYLVMKTEGDLQDRLKRLAPRLMITFFILNTLVVVAMVVQDQDITARYRQDIWPVIVPAAALGALVLAWRFMRQGKELRAFLSSAAVIALLLFSVAIGLFPNLLISTTNSAYDLTVYNASAADNTLQVCLIVAIIGMPFVLAYTAGVYFFFRGKTTVESEGY